MLQQNDDAMDSPNIIFIMLDTLRADYLDVYKGWIRTKTMKAMAEKGTVYLNAVAPGTYTLTSHASIFLGKRVRSMKQFLVDPMKKRDLGTDYLLTKYVEKGSPTLARRLGELGYDTVMFTNNVLVSNVTGLADGFSHVEDIETAEQKREEKKHLQLVLKLMTDTRVRSLVTPLIKSLAKVSPKRVVDIAAIKFMKRWGAEVSNYGNKLDSGARRTNRIVSDYLAGARTSGNFIFLNYGEAHEAYPTKLVTDRYIEQNRWLYISGVVDKKDAEFIKLAYGKRVRYLDKRVGELLSVLKDRGLLGNALVIITGDHGQAFLEHGLMYHGMFPYNEIARVPLIIGRFVNGKQVRSRRVVEKPVSLSALYDYILGMASGRRPADSLVQSRKFTFSDHTGTDIFNPSDVYEIKALKDRSDYLKRLYELKKYHNTFATAVYSGRLKLIHFFSPKIKDVMFDTRSDPGETRNVIGEHKKEASAAVKAAEGDDC